VKIGVVVPMAEADSQVKGQTPGWPLLRSFALAAEAQGLDSLWVFDHFFDKAKDGTFTGQHEAWTVVSALSAVTQRVQIGTLVMCSSFRSPALVAKMAAAADEVSGGRLILGLGAGWHDPEYDAFGFPKDHRVDRFEEALEIIVPLVRGRTVSFEGRYHQARDAVLVPAPSHPIPILIASFGPRMLGLTARHADAWNTAWFGAPDQVLQGQMKAFDEALSAEGRDPTAVSRTVAIIVNDPAANVPDQDGEDSSFSGSVDELARALDAYEALDIEHLIVLVQPLTEASLGRLTSAIALR
jgi:alkanesulfonate monooxygenase SsuD/methylene tetrahydromethanopterin reductase-like flavin-dependent oxidoreductase (luciferase family)